MNLLKDIIETPSIGVYSLLDEDNTKAYVCVVKNFVTWLARQANDIKNDVHNHKFTKTSTIKLEFQSDNIDVLRQAHMRITKEYAKAGWTLCGEKRLSKYKVKYLIRHKKVLLQVVNSRGRVVREMDFDKMSEAKQYAKTRTIEDILNELKGHN